MLHKLHLSVTHYAFPKTITHRMLNMLQCFKSTFQIIPNSWMDEWGSYLWNASANVEAKHLGCYNKYSLVGHFLYRHICIVILCLYSCYLSWASKLTWTKLICLSFQVRFESMTSFFTSFTRVILPILYLSLVSNPN